MKNPGVNRNERVTTPDDFRSPSSVLKNWDWLPHQSRFFLNQGKGEVPVPHVHVPHFHHAVNATAQATSNKWLLITYNKLERPSSW
jgi:hypothetical protein